MTHPSVVEVEKSDPEALLNWIFVIGDGTASRSACSGRFIPQRVASDEEKPFPHFRLHDDPALASFLH